MSPILGPLPLGHALTVGTQVVSSNFSLSANDDKMYIIPNDPEHRALALGHYSFI